MSEQGNGSTFSANEQKALTREQVLAELRGELRKGVYTREGMLCPCCKRLAKVYKRRINAGMVRALLDMVRATPKLPVERNGFVKVGMDGEVKTAGGDYSKLQWWGLIEPLPGENYREDGSTRIGFWKVTQAGHLFVRGEASVRKYVYEFDGARVRDPEDADTSLAVIGEVVENYDYEEMMRVP